MRMKTAVRPRMLVTALAVGAVMVLAACGNSGGSGTSSTPSPSPWGGSGGGSGSSVSIANYAFSPATLSVKAGTTVTWTNNDSAQHNVVSTDGPGTDAATTSTFASANLSQGRSFSHSFSKVGTYYYECTIHAAMASMHAKVVVK